MSAAAIQRYASTRKSIARRSPYQLLRTPTTTQCISDRTETKHSNVPQRNTANTAPAPTSAPAPILATAAAPELVPDAVAEAVFDPPEEPVPADALVVWATVGVGVTTLVM